MKIMKICVFVACLNCDCPPAPSQSHLLINSRFGPLISTWSSVIPREAVTDVPDSYLASVSSWNVGNNLQLQILMQLVLTAYAEIFKVWDQSSRNSVDSDKPSIIRLTLFGLLTETVSKISVIGYCCVARNNCLCACSIAQAPLFVLCLFWFYYWKFQCLIFIVQHLKMIIQDTHSYFDFFLLR
jgi:hypothetical protein